MPPGGSVDARAVTRKRIETILEEIRDVGPSMLNPVLTAIDRTQDEGLRFQLWESASTMVLNAVADAAGDRPLPLARRRQRDRGAAGDAAADVRGVDEGRPQELEGERQARQRQQRLLRVRRAARQQERHGAAQPHGDALQRVAREEQAGGAQIPGGVIGLAHRFLLSAWPGRLAASGGVAFLWHSVDGSAWVVEEEGGLCSSSCPWGSSSYYAWAGFRSCVRNGRGW